MGACPDALYQHLFSDLSAIIPTGGRRGFAASLLQDSILKKYKASSPESDARALDKFYLSNDHCREFFLTCNSFADEQVDSTVVHYLHRFFSLTFPDEIEVYGFGPGSSAEVRGCSYYQKVSGTPSATSRDVYRFYLDIIRHSPSMLACERERRESQPSFKQVSGNKLCFVPKNIDSSRVIAVEPSLNMFLQKGVGRSLERTLAEVYHIDIADQQGRNRRMAKLGSINRSFSTIDLKSASDSVSMSFCRKFLPPILFETLCIIRSPCTSHDNSLIVNHMISSMGNATTFPLQTIIFSTIVVACYEVLGIPVIYNNGCEDGNFGVFGDDIIVLEEAFSFVTATLVRLGFMLNKDKTFSGFNPFRESCGGDYYMGYNVRPVYCTTLDTTPDVCSLINRLIIWSARHTICLRNTIGYLGSFVKKGSFVPLYEDVSAGVRMPLSTHVKKLRIPNTLFKYECWIRERNSFRVTEDERDYKKRRMCLNTHALFLSFLQGSIRRNVLTFRIEKERCKKISIITPVWDFIDRSSFLLEEVSDCSYRYTMESYLDLLS